VSESSKKGDVAVGNGGVGGKIVIPKRIALLREATITRGRMWVERDLGHELGGLCNSIGNRGVIKNVTDDFVKKSMLRQVSCEPKRERDWKFLMDETVSVRVLP